MMKKTNLNNHNNHNNVQLQVQNDEKDEQFLQKLILPHDLITQLIITKLPIKSLLQLKSISKQWYSTISSPHFGITHFKSTRFNRPFNPTLHNLFVQCGYDYFIYSYDECNKSLFKFDINFIEPPADKISVIGSCNGLVCLYCSSGYMIIFNPVINQWVKIPYPLLDGCEQCTWGFGYLSSTNDYKIVRITELDHNPTELSVHVLSLRTQKWKQVYDDILQKYTLLGASLSAGVLINETIYWIVYQKPDYEQDILGYDLVLEKFISIKGLIPSNSYLGLVSFVCCMGGCLSMARFTNRGDMSVSILKQSGQVDYIGVYRDLDLGSCCSAVGFTKDEKFFVQVGNRELGIVDPNSSPKSYTPVFKFKEGGFNDFKSYFPSLLSPFAVTGTRE
ncbi:hypothetical protein RND81_12G101400 [Saponaria officinalis]|uniref:F-box domain-containing protein n=1 Tax=Saponaria officinalis TaxID=3572 RepID=A0AAW1H8R9_SAPOF